ncbi:MAG: prepilin-type N-terminal cleavage/methylation domain-containing protein [Acidobacteriota bacterium]|nr:prepilin-type N-terminal cleavage/methylation domain-containing protein [Acidobacteriota bacterium]
MKNQKGFTLIELLLVLAIIGIISAIAIPALLGQRERAKAKAVQGNVDAIGGECARVNDTLKENGTVADATQVVASVLSLSNYSASNAPNPYQGNLAAFGTDKTFTTGETACVGTLYADPSTGMSYSAVQITGYYLEGSQPKSVQKIVALD